MNLSQAAPHVGERFSHEASQSTAEVRRRGRDDDGGVDGEPPARRRRQDQSRRRAREEDATDETPHFKNMSCVSE